MNDITKKILKNVFMLTLSILLMAIVMLTLKGVLLTVAYVTILFLLIINTAVYAFQTIKYCKLLEVEKRD